MDGEQPLVVTSKHTVTNTITAPDNYLSLLQPSEPGTTLFETNTYYNTIALTKTLTDSDVSKVISTTDVVRQVVITELLPSKSTSVMTSYIAIDAEGNQNPANKNDHPASPLLSATDVVKTYYVTYTYYNTYLVNGSSIVRTNVSTSSDIVTEHLYIYPTKKAQLTPATTAATSALLKAELLPNTDLESDDDESLQTINVYATKTMMTTFTYYTTMEQGPNGEDASAPLSSAAADDDEENELVSTVVSSRTRVIENVVTESIPMKFLPPSAIKRLKLMLYGSAQKTANAENLYTTVVTLIGGQPLEITAARHPVEMTSASFSQLPALAIEVVPEDEKNVIESNETDSSKNELDSDDQESAASNDLEANETGQSPNQIVQEAKPAVKTNATKIVKTTASPVSNLIGSWNFNGLKVLRPMIDAVAGLINTNFGNAQSHAASAPLVHTTPRPLPQSLPTIPEYITSYTNGLDQQQQLQQQPNIEDIPKPLPNIEPAIGQARNPIYIPVNGNVDSAVTPIAGLSTLNSFTAATHGKGEALNRTHGAKIPLLNGGIPISPGEIITANSDVILGRPTGNRPRIPLNKNNNLPPPPIPHDPNIPFNMLPPLVTSPETGDSNSVQSIQSEAYVGPPPPVPHLQLPKINSNNKIPIHRQKSPPHFHGPPPFGQSNPIHLNRIRAQYKPLPSNLIQKEQSHRVLRPNVIPIKHAPTQPVHNVEVHHSHPHQQHQHQLSQQQHQQLLQHQQHPHHHRNPQEQHEIDSAVAAAVNTAQNDIIEIQRIPEVFSTDLPPVHIYNSPQKIISMPPSSFVIEPSRSSSSTAYSNHHSKFAGDIQSTNRLPEVVESATGQPLFVNIQPSQMANVVIPHGSSSALIYGGVQEVHKSGEYFDDPSPYPHDDQATFSIGHQSKSPIISAPSVEVQPAILAAVLHNNYDSSSSSSGNFHFVKAPIASNQKVNVDSHVLSQDIDMHAPPIIFRNPDTYSSISATSSAEHYPNDIQIIHGGFGQVPNRPSDPSPPSASFYEPNQVHAHQNRPMQANLVRAQSPFNVDIESINLGMSSNDASAGLSTPSLTSSASIENDDDDRSPIEHSQAPSANEQVFDHHKDDDYENDQGEVIQESNAVPQLIASGQATSLAVEANVNRIPSYAESATKPSGKVHRAPFTQTEANSLAEDVTDHVITEQYSARATTTTTEIPTTVLPVLPSLQPPQANQPPPFVHIPQIPPGMINEMYTASRYRNQTTSPVQTLSAAVNHGHIRKPFFSQLSNERPLKQNLYANTLVPLQHLRPPPQFASAPAFDRRRPPVVLAHNSRPFDPNYTRKVTAMVGATSPSTSTKQNQLVDASHVRLSTANYISTHRPLFPKTGSHFRVSTQSTTGAATVTTTPKPTSPPGANLFDPTRGKPFKSLPPPPQSSSALNLNTGEVTFATTTTSTTDAATHHPSSAQEGDFIRNTNKLPPTNTGFDKYHISHSPSHLIVPPLRQSPSANMYPKEPAVEMRPPPPAATPSTSATPPSKPYTSHKPFVHIEAIDGMEPPPLPQAKRKQKPKVEMHKINPEHVNELSMSMSPPRLIRPTQTASASSSPVQHSNGQSKLTNYVTVDAANEPAPTSSVEIVPISYQPVHRVRVTTKAPITPATQPEELDPMDEYVRFSIGSNGRHQDSHPTPTNVQIVSEPGEDDIIILGSEQSSFGHSEVAPSQPSSSVSHGNHVSISSSSPSPQFENHAPEKYTPRQPIQSTATDPLPTKYITSYNTKTLTVTTTKTTVIRSAGITTTLTLTLTKTQTETIIDTITHTLLKPTRIGYDPVIKPTIFTAPITIETTMANRGGSLTSVIPNPSFSIYANIDDSDHNVSEEIKSVEMDDDEGDRRESIKVSSTVSSRMRIRPTSARPTPNRTHGDDSIFVVMTDRKKLGLINLGTTDVLSTLDNDHKSASGQNDSEDDDDDDDDNDNLPKRDEDDVTNDVSHVLLGGILIATPPRSEVSKGKGATTITSTSTSSKKKKQRPNNHYDIDLNAEVSEHLDDNVAAVAADNAIDESKHDLQRVMAIDGCVPECKAINNEMCHNIDGIARCICRPGFARMFPDHPCQRKYFYLQL